jgi:hypothetical protein
MLASLLVLVLSGAAHLSQASDGCEYRLVAVLQSPDPCGNGEFGDVVAIGGRVVLVGEPNADVGNVREAGRVHVFDLEGVFIKTLLPPEPRVSGGFGWRIATGKERIAVTDRWGVYVYDSGVEFLLELAFPWEDKPLQRLGLDVDEGVLAVGCSNLTRGAEGAVHLFDNGGGLLATLRSPEPEADPRYHSFGASVALGGGIVAVGEDHSRVEGAEGLGDAGRVHIYDLEGTHLRTLEPPDPLYWGCFGGCLDVSGGLLYVNEPDEGGLTGLHREGAGRVHVYDAGGELLRTIGPPDPGAPSPFGAVAVGGGVIVVGEPRAEAGGVGHAGRVHVFGLDGGLLCSLRSPAPQLYGEFGGGSPAGPSVAVRGEVIVVGEHFANAEGVFKAGRAYVFRRVARLGLSGLAISPEAVAEGGAVAVSVECVNLGSLSGSGEVALRVGGEVAEVREVSLGPGEVGTVVFEVCAAGEGVQAVEVDGLSGSFLVRGRGSLDRVPGYPLGAVALGLVLAAVMLVFGARGPGLKRGRAQGAR